MNTNNESTAALLPVRWYVVTNYGAATLCVDEADARKVARKCDLEWPKNAPHVAVQLAPVASESRGSELDGFVLVPREATKEMLDAACASQDRGDWIGGFYFQRAWPHMLAAAPTPPAVANGEPTAEQWMTAIRVWYYSQHHGMGCDPTAEWIAAYARSAAAKGEG